MLKDTMLKDYAKRVFRQMGLEGRSPMTDGVKLPVLNARSTVQSQWIDPILPTSLDKQEQPLLKSLGKKGVDFLVKISPLPDLAKEGYKVVRELDKTTSIVENAAAGEHFFGLQHQPSCCSIEIPL